MSSPFTPTLLTWYAQNGRHHLPWQKNSWYARLVSEVMLQQTQVATVIPYFERFMNAFPTPRDLARAPDDQVMALWAGLGYYSRARNLLKAVRTVVDDYAGNFPKTAKELTALPGIGPSTAGAVSAFVNNERAVMMDGNAKRVIARVFGIEGYPGQTVFEKQLWAQGLELLPAQAQMPAYTQALMDMGALICKRRPECPACPMSDFCRSYLTGRTAEIPGKKPKKERPVRHAVIVFYFYEDCLWVQKRLDKGVWQDLWVPPMIECEPQADALAVLEAHRELGEPVFRWTEQALTHDFSHYRLILYPVVCEMRDGPWRTALTRVAPEQIQAFALPSPIRKLYEKIEPVRKIKTQGLSLMMGK